MLDATLERSRLYSLLKMQHNVHVYISVMISVNICMVVRCGSLSLCFSLAPCALADVDLVECFACTTYLYGRAVDASRLVVSVCVYTLSLLRYAPRSLL